MLSLGRKLGAKDSNTVFPQKAMESLSGKDLSSSRAEALPEWEFFSAAKQQQRGHKPGRKFSEGMAEGFWEFDA